MYLSSFCEFIYLTVFISQLSFPFPLLFLVIPPISSSLLNLLLLLHFSSEKGRLPMDIKQQWQIKLPRDWAYPLLLRLDETIP